MGYLRSGNNVALGAMGIGDGKVLHSNMAEGDMVSLGGESHTELGWTIYLNEDGEAGSGSVIYSGDEISIKGMGNGLWMHDNSEDGGGASLGSYHPEHGWIITLCDGGDGRISLGDDCMLTRMSDGKCMHSNSAEGSGFSFGGISHTELGWSMLDCGNPEVEYGTYLVDGCNVHVATLGLGDGR